MNKENIIKAYAISNGYEFKLGQLSLLLGQRSVLAKEIIDAKWDRFKSPEKYKALLVGAYNDYNNQIKQLLAID